MSTETVGAGSGGGSAMTATHSPGALVQVKRRIADSR